MSLLAFWGETSILYDAVCVGFLQWQNVFCPEKKRLQCFSAAPDAHQLSILTTFMCPVRCGSCWAMFDALCSNRPVHRPHTAIVSPKSEAPLMHQKGVDGGATGELRSLKSPANAGQGGASYIHPCHDSWAQIPRSGGWYRDSPIKQSCRIGATSSAGSM